MKNYIHSVLVGIEIIFLILVFVSSTGCIRHLPIGNAGTNGTYPGSPDPVAIDTPSPGDNVLSGNSSAVPSVAATTLPEKLEVTEVDPRLYVTPDPYQLPYRDHGNWTTGEANRVPKIAQFTKKIILRSNSTAFGVNVTKGPLVIDLTFSPNFPTRIRQVSMVRILSFLHTQK